VFALRRAHPVLRREAFYTDEEIRWFDPSGTSPDWSDVHQRCLACLIRCQGERALYLMFNAGPEPIAFLLPPSPSPGQWLLAVDTGQPPPRDCCAAGDEGALVQGTSYAVGPRSAAVLVARSR
jgi:glycogen operon protein